MVEPIRHVLSRVPRPVRRGDAVILMYHRIAPPEVAGGGVAVSPARFEQHLQALREHFRPFHLSTLVAHHGDGTSVKRSVVVTFDDGYLDNLTVAKPLLERYAIPATVFVVSGYVGSGRRFWWDELERICLSTAELPERLELRIQGETASWRTSGERRQLFRDLRERLGPLERGERDDLLERLQTWAGLEPADTLETLGVDDLRMLAAGEAVAIGAHTATHPRLPAVSRERQLEEIRSSREQLSALLDRDVTLFSYPFGAHDEVTVACAREAGVVCACTTAHGAVRPSSDPHRLPRVYVGDWEADELLEQVAARLG